MKAAEDMEAGAAAPEAPALTVFNANSGEMVPAMPSPRFEDEQKAKERAEASYFEHRYDILQAPTPSPAQQQPMPPPQQAGEEHHDDVKEQQARARAMARVDAALHEAEALRRKQPAARDTPLGG